MTMTLEELLEADHRRVRWVLFELSAASDAAVVDRLAGIRRLVRELLPHLVVEEMLLFPALEEDLEEAAGAGAAVKALAAEHSVIKRLLAELDLTRPEAEEWGARLVRLGEALESHMLEEERVAFTAARDLARGAAYWPAAPLVLEVKRKALGRIA